METKKRVSKKEKSSNVFYTLLANVKIKRFKFKLFKNEGQEMLFVAIGTFICFSIVLFLRLLKLMQ